MLSQGLCREFLEIYLSDSLILQVSLLVVFVLWGSGRDELQGLSACSEMLAVEFSCSNLFSIDWSTFSVSFEKKRPLIPLIL